MYRIKAGKYTMRVEVQRPYDDTIRLNAYVGNRRYAYIDARIVGPNWRLDEPYLLISYVYVTPSLRREGVATSLVSLLKKVTGVNNVLMTSLSED